MPDIFEIAEQHRRELLQRERWAASEMARAYGTVWQRIKARLDALAEQMARARARGEEISPSWLFQYERLQSLQRQVEAEIREFARYAEQAIIAEQAEAARAAQEHAEQLALARLGEAPPGVIVTWARLPHDAVTDLVGFLSDGSPLRDLLDELGPDASKAVREALVAGVATGQNPRVIARQVRQALGGNLVRALTISRTEMLRSYREASRRSYAANADIMEGWVWHAALDRRTCAFCWSQHGTLHRVDEVMATHPRCRCTMAPRTVGWDKILGEKGKGIPDTRPRIEKGEDLFEQLPDERKRAILGPAKFAAYQNGKLKLADVAGFRRDKRWGPVGYERSLRDILGPKEAKRWREKAIDREAISQRMKAQWRDAKARRDERVRQIAAMSDNQLAADIRRHQQAKWRSTDLLEHVKKHQRQYAAYMGHAVGPSEIEEISKLVLTSWDRLFSNVDASGVVSYTFLAHWQASDVLLTVTRGGRIRTLIPTDHLSAFLGRHPDLVEVTGRARKLGI